MKKVTKNKMVRFLDSIIRKTLIKVYGVDSNIYKLLSRNIHLKEIQVYESTLGDNVKLYPPYKLSNSQVGDYTYISENLILNNTSVGKFCSIGPNLISGWGIHPTNGLSTHPMFYSTKKQNGVTYCKNDKVEETKKIIIGNDVFIGMNVTILDGVTIGDGAVIGAGSVVSKDIPPYAIAIGNPINVIKYRFDEEKINQLLEIKWWNFEKADLSLIDEYFFDVDQFINKYKK